MDQLQRENLTPLMKQYFEIRDQFDDALLLFQVGDFYELFFDDAKNAAAFLGIALTKRGKLQSEPIPLCGFPVHVLDHYVTKLVRGGFKIALCQQLDEAVAGKMVRRGVTQVFTPGTLTSENLLDAKKPSFLFSFFPMKDSWGLLFSELLTSQLHATILPASASRSLETELFRFLPDEILLFDQRGMGKHQDFFRQRGFFTTKHKALLDDENIALIKAWCQQQFDKETCKKLYENQSLMSSLALWHLYLEKNQKDALNQFKDINFYSPDEFLLLDSATQKNLDIVSNSFDGTSKNSLVSFMDRGVTPMGSRMIRRWMMRPLVDQAAIHQRQQVVSLLSKNPQLISRLKILLEQFGDLERTVGRIALQKAHLRDYVHLGKIVGLIPELCNLVRLYGEDLLQHVVATCVDYSTLFDLLTKSCNDDDQQKWIIKSGFDETLDSLRDLVSNSDRKILELEKEEQKRTGINSLKIRQNNVHGYYIEVTKVHTDLVPEDYVRKQTLVGRERYTMPGLAQLQLEIIQAQQSIDACEKELFNQVKQQVSQFINPLKTSARAIAMLDGLLGFAIVAYDYDYCRPQFHDNRDIIISGGRHPIVAAQLNNGFIANDTQLVDDQSLWIVTGPNMGGKSTYLRQIALISVLAQSGSFVPAISASLPLIDRIFTRIGAGDNLAEGKSTFLVEMEETAQICMQATSRSLVILDEVGRGTSTFDGLALAQAVVEYIYQVVKARCLFATHYHELTHLEQQHDGIVSYYADSKKTEQGILLLHKIIKGVADGSFGLEVAKIAKLPSSVLIRAQQLLDHLEREKSGQSQMTFLPATAMKSDDQLQQKYEKLSDSYQKQQNIVKKIASINCNNLSPKQAFDLLWEIKQEL